MAERERERFRERKRERGTEGQEEGEKGRKEYSIPRDPPLYIYSTYKHKVSRIPTALVMAVQPIPIKAKEGNIQFRNLLLHKAAERASKID